ncbi:MAG: T9SS type A sorting domain-containing protein [Ferruginibacter sp.]|nr:T9SS type A sorting domain-containing protein [Chitinophagaceae bacterium]
MNCFQRSLFLLVHFMTFALVIRAQQLSVYQQLVAVNKEWTNQADVRPSLKSKTALSLPEVQLIRLHLSETEKLLRQRSIAHLSPQQKKNRANYLNTLHSYWQQGVFPKNTFHPGRQPYFIDIFNTYCAVGYLMKQSGADKMARDIYRTQNFSYLKEIRHPSLSEWVENSGFTVGELALIQPGYVIPPLRVATIMEMHYANAGPDVNEYIEFRQSVNPMPAGLYLRRVDFFDHQGVLYKSIYENEMQSFNTAGLYYYYQFPPGENFADSGTIRIKYLLNGIYGDLTVYTYSSSQVTIFDGTTFGAVHRTYPVAENENTLPGSSLNFCGTYYSPLYNGWDLISMAASVGTLNACVLLPLDLLAFNYVLENNSVRLKWKTTSEVNTDRFEVERSTDGLNFSNIGTVRSTGTSNSPKDYNLVDASPGAMNYYRLKQIDRYNKFSYSTILNVKFKGDNPLTVQPTIVVADQLRVNIGLQQREIGIIQVYDLSGRALIGLTGSSGYNEINVSNISAGIYIIRLQTQDGKVYSQRFVKQ